MHEWLARCYNILYIHIYLDFQEKPIKYNLFFFYRFFQFGKLLLNVCNINKSFVYKDIQYAYTMYH